MALNSIPAFPTPADFDPNILAEIEPIWLAFAREEKLTHRWVTLLNRDGNRIGVDRQKNDGRSTRVGVFDTAKGLYATYEKRTQKSYVVTVSDMCEAVYKHWLARPTNQDVEDFSRRFGQLYEGTRVKDTKFIIRLIKGQTSARNQPMLHSGLPGVNVTGAVPNHPTAQDNIRARPVPPSAEPSRRVVSNPNITRSSAAAPIPQTPSPLRSSSVKTSAIPLTGKYGVRPTDANRAFSSAATPSTNGRPLATSRNPKKSIEINLTTQPLRNRNQSSDVRRGVIKDTSTPKRISSGPRKEALLGRPAGKAASRDVSKDNRYAGGEDSWDHMDLDPPDSDGKYVDSDVPRFPAKRGSQYLYALESANKKSPKKPFAYSTSANTTISRPPSSRKPVFGGGYSAKDSVNKTVGPGSRGTHSFNGHGTNKTPVPSISNSKSFVNNKNNRHTGPGTGFSTDRFYNSNSTRKPPSDSTSKMLTNTTSEPENHSERRLDETLGVEAVGYMCGRALETASDTEATGDMETPEGHNSSRGLTTRSGTSVGTGYRKMEGHDGSPQSAADRKAFGWFPDTSTPTKPAAGLGTDKGGKDSMGNERSRDREVSTSSGDSAARLNQGFGRDTASGSMGPSDGYGSGYPGNRRASGYSGFSTPRASDGTAVEPAERRGRLGSGQYSNSPFQRSGDPGIGAGMAPGRRAPVNAPTGPRNREASGHADRLKAREEDQHARARPRSKSFGPNGMRSDERHPEDQRLRAGLDSRRSDRDYSHSGSDSHQHRRDS